MNHISLGSQHATEEPEHGHGHANHSARRMSGYEPAREP